MIKIEKTEVAGWKPAIRGMRNPMNSWDKSDSEFCHIDGECHDILWNTKPLMEDEGAITIGKKDLDTMIRLAKAGGVDAKFRRMIVVYADITAPLYWWKEFDTYKVGTVANSCSTMHKIHEKCFKLDDFSHEHLLPKEKDILLNIIKVLNETRDLFIVNNSKTNTEDMIKRNIYWWQMIQLLPNSYNQKRTVMLNYEVLANIYPKRRNHKLDEWHDFCDWIKELPYSEIITEEMFI